VTTLDGTQREWRVIASIGAALICVAAGVWVFMGGERMGLISSVDLGFHELGHLLFSWAPGLVPPLIGSATQVAVPIGLALYFGLRRESYASGLMFAWAATSAANVSVYVADAPFQGLTLLGGGRHDWAWVFGSTGHLDWAAPFASGVRWFGVALAVIGMFVAIAPLLTPHMRERAEARDRIAREAREAELRAKAPRREPRNLPDAPRRQAPPTAPAGRF
jgi:hypothetical protein